MARQVPCGQPGLLDGCQRAEWAVESKGPLLGWSDDSVCGGASWELGPGAGSCRNSGSTRSSLRRRPLWSWAPLLCTRFSSSTRPGGGHRVRGPPTQTCTHCSPTVLLPHCGHSLRTPAPMPPLAPIPALLVLQPLVPAQMTFGPRMPSQCSQLCWSLAPTIPKVPSMSQVCRFPVTLLGASARELSGSGGRWVPLSWVPGVVRYKNVGSEPQPEGEVWWAKEGSPPLAHLASAGRCAASFGNLHTCGRERLLCSSPAWSPPCSGSASPGDHAWGQHSLPGRVSNTSLWAATELTSFPRSSGCFSPGCGVRSIAGRPGRPLPAARPGPPRPRPRPQPRSPAAHPAQLDLVCAQAVLRQDGLQRLLQPLGGFGRDEHHALQRRQLQPARDPRAAEGRSAGPASPTHPHPPARDEAGPEPGSRASLGWGLSPGDELAPGEGPAGKNSDLHTDPNPGLAGGALTGR